MVDDWRVVDDWKKHSGDVHEWKPALPRQAAFLGWELGPSFKPQLGLPNRDEIRRLDLPPPRFA